MTNWMLVALLYVASTAQAAEIRKTVGPDGRMTLSNVPTQVKVAGAPGKPGLRASVVPTLLQPDVIGAVANVMGIAHLVSSSRTFCVAASPTSYKRYSSAADAWTLRNAAVVSQKERVMSIGDQHLVASALSTDMVRQTDELMRPIRDAATAEKIAWCNKAFADVDKGVLDLVGRASISPLMSYRLR